MNPKWQTNGGRRISCFDSPAPFACQIRFEILVRQTRPTTGLGQLPDELWPLEPKPLRDVEDGLLLLLPEPLLPLPVPMRP